MTYPIRVWKPDDEDYPYRLRECYDKPSQLFVKGNIPSMEGHVVAIVGTRHATERGRELTNALVRDLAANLDSLTIVSGGAYGIDIAAHRAALQYGVPTVMVLAHGLDKMYPYQHINEANAAMENGGLVSEYPEGTEAFAGNFLQRNRIIAGLADAVVIVESKVRGGSLCTARYALDYNRELFAFPGRPTDETSLGCNLLIRRNKAQLIHNAAELIERAASVEAGADIRDMIGHVLTPGVGRSAVLRPECVADAAVIDAALDIAEVVSDIEELRRHVVEIPCP